MRTFMGVCLALAAVMAAGPVRAYTGDITVVLLDSGGNPVDGGQVMLGVGGWPLKGETGDSGPGTLTFAYVGGDNMAVRVTAPNYGSTQTTPFQDLSVNSTFTLQTKELVVKLIDHNGATLDGGSVNIGHGGWPNIGTTGDDGPGEVRHEMFVPGYAQVRMTLWGVSETKTITTPTTTFQTGLVSLCGGPYQRGVGGWPPFVNPSEMLPVPHKFRRPGGPEFWITPVAGSSVSGGMLRLVDAQGAGLAGGVAQPALGGSWKPVIPGATDANGYLSFAVDYTPTKIRMTVNQSGQEQTAAEMTASNCTWQTSEAVIDCNDSAGNPLAGVVIDQGGGYWDTNKAVTGPTGIVTIPIFAGASPKFRANYGGTSLTITQSIVSPFVFQTGAVVSDSGTCIKWANGSWKTFVQSMEIFPGSYKFVFSDGTATTIYAIVAGAVNHIH